MKKRRAFALTVAVPVFLIAYQTAPAMAHTPKTVKMRSPKLSGQ